MSPAVRVGNPRAPGPGAAVVAEDEEEAAAAVAWRELRGKAAELAAAAEERAILARRIEAALQVRREALRQAEELDELRQRVDLQQARLEAAVIGRSRALDGVERGKELLQEQIERVLPLSRALTTAHQRVQEAKEALSGDKFRLKDLQRLLRTRQQCMVSHVAGLYPVKVFHDLPRHAENPCDDTNGEHGTLPEENGTFSGGNGTHLPTIIKSPQACGWTFFGWDIMKHKMKQKSYRNKELQRSAAVLGYAAHAVLLIACYLDVPLRYPLRFGGSRSYVSDRLPSADTASAGLASTRNTKSQLTEYPLFLESQEDDSTSASYAIYLLHKDTEQLLNYVGAESCGRHVFGNLRELLRIIQSDEFVYR
ncbi:UV radiation resistance-associated gene protein isoform X2 [Sorghum bicolor]|nr:UV radiation resistance-associated gene protein isoform X2 [Sorghum bicolor]|eukprot:XP_002441294.2 UV radiation resistance-associated gene protein isoform X2 [Sorghum bicolor]